GRSGRWSVAGRVKKRMKICRVIGKNVGWVNGFHAANFWRLFQKSPLAPVLGGEGSGVRGFLSLKLRAPHPNPSPPSTGARGFRNSLFGLSSPTAIFRAFRSEREFRRPFCNTSR